MLVLFPHHSAILSTKNITWRQASIQPSSPVLSPEYEWEEARTNLYGSVLKTPSGYEMFYQCGNALRLARAVSEDGISWSKPFVNYADFSNEREQGVVLTSITNRQSDAECQKQTEPPSCESNLVASAHMPTLMYEEGALAPYKMFAFWHEGYTCWESEDGMSFEPVAEPAIPIKLYENPHTGKKWVSDVSPAFKDGKRYVAMAKTYELDANKLTRRCVGRTESEDLQQWSDVKTVWQPGEDEDKLVQAKGFAWADFYGLCPFRYGEAYLGFLWLFEISHEFESGTHLGKMEVFLASSPDGIQWERVSDEAFIPWDLNFGEQGGMTTTASAPIFEENEIKIYYSDSNYEHGYAEKDFGKPLENPTWVVRCAQLPKERLLGAYATEGVIDIDTGSLDKKMLRLNADCAEGCMILRYYSAQGCEGEHRVEALDDTNIYIEPLGKTVIRIELTLMNATLYALEVI